ncbi:hypothetical protein KBY83_05865 [Cyanobium sp. WKJ7-Wakatipu]|uniref:hypothetical protein n=1 Tax=Cyanobium sp. WKJ7-Wakatipu TaxID=2823726 RepID=UPI0020CD5216|nr:hypothetical protein [Cyanobium sp. WKJ7-Wakatipu]MCP9782848.1 hypothetical protein [Cyanobium sp. WKJ7-Wakatipu]
MTLTLQQAQRLHSLIVDRKFDWLRKPPAKDWFTVNNYPIRPEHLLSGEPTATRPGQGLTRWLVIDIDAGGRYHPKNNPDAIPKILQLLAEQGLEGVLIVQSSDSRGIHLWVPIPPQLTSIVAKWLEDLIRLAGFQVQPGHLELFPNVTKKGSLPYGIRLPLIAPDSCVLDQDLTPVHRDVGAFCDQWEAALAVNDSFALAPGRDADPDARGYWHLIPEARYRLQRGFTGPKQTDELAAQAAYLAAWEGLSGAALQKRMCALLLAAPGCRQFSSHYRHIAAGTLVHWWQHYSKHGGERCKATAGQSEYARPKAYTHNADLASGRAQLIEQAVLQLSDAGLAFPTLTAAREAVAELVKQQSGKKPGVNTLRKQDQLLLTLLETPLASCIDTAVAK